MRLHEESAIQQWEFWNFGGWSDRESSQPGVPTRAVWLPSPRPWRQRSALRSSASSWHKTPELLLPPVVMRILWPGLTCV